MTMHIERLVASVSAIETVTASVEEVITRLVDELRNAPDMVAVNAAVDQLEAAKARLAAAVVAGTPVVEPPVEPPAEPPVEEPIV